MKYLTNFKTKEEYEAFKASGEYITPNVSFIETAGSVINDSYQVPTSGGGGGNTGGGVIYLDITQVVAATGSQMEMLLCLFPILMVKGHTTRTEIKPAAFYVLQKEYESISACAILPNFRGTVDSDNAIDSNSTIEQLKQMGAFEITEEEFYNLNGGGVA